MLNLSKIILNTILLIIICFGIEATSVAAQNELVIEGNVLGYELNMVKPFGTVYIPDYPALVKITKVLKGEEKSQYIIVLLKPLTKESAEKEFGLNKITTFRLARRINYVGDIKNLLHSGFTIENENVVKTDQTFTFVSGVEKQSLPLKKKFPYYVEMDEDNGF